MLISLPFIHEYSARVQLAILLALLFTSYLNARARLVVGSLTGAYIAFLILVPAVSWTIYLIKKIAWLGFYVYFFKKALQYGYTAWNYISGEGLETLVRELDKHGR